MQEIQSLKNKILMLAIQGKLVPQMETEEPASVLLQKIQQEKEQLIKEKKIKKEKNESIIYKKDNQYFEKIGTIEKDITENIPFEIPENWQWIRLKELIKIIHYGYTASASQIGNVKLLRITDIQNNTVDWDAVPFCNITNNNLISYQLEKNDIVIARTGGTVGKSFCISEIPFQSVFASYLIRIKLLYTDIINYIITYLDSPCYWEQLISSTAGIGQPNVNSQSLSSLFIPLPPLAEQERIVKKLEEIFSQLEHIEKNKKELEMLKTAFKNKLLYKAIQGKLVPEIKTEEPASVLLQKIQLEKKKLIKDKKIKNNKQESVIYKKDNHYYEKIGDIEKDITKEIPFEIPKTWQWVRLEELLYLITGVSYQKNDLSTIGIRILRGGNIQLNHVVFCNDDAVLPLSYYDKEKTLHQGDIVIVASTGSKALIGKAGYVKNSEETTMIGAFLRICRLYNNNLSSYLKLFFESNYYRNYIREKVKGTMINNIKENYITELLFPLPPLEEQYRIAKKIEEIFTLCEKL